MSKKQNIKRPTIIVSGLILLAAVLVFASGALSSQAQTAVPEGEVVTAFMGNLSAQATASGVIKPLRQSNLSAGTPGLITMVHVGVGDEVEAGQPLIQLDTVDLELNVRTALQSLRLKEASLESLLEPASPAEIVAAQANVASAQANLEDLQAGPSPAELAMSEAGIRASEASLSSSNAELARIQDSTQTSQRVAAEAALLAAQMSRDQIQEINEAHPNAANHQALLEANQSVASAQAALNDLLAGPDTSAAYSGVAAARARLEGSRIDRDALTAGATTTELAGAQLQLAQAEATLASLLAGPTAEEIAAAEAEVKQAQLSLADAQEQLAAATITAPFAGVVVAVNGSEGEVASGVLVELIDHTSLELVLSVDEIDVGQLQTGQQATVSLETWPDVDISSQVTSIAPGANIAPGTALVTYDVHLALGETDIPVRTGMSAAANLITAEKENVLLVPNKAINADRTAGTYSVNLIVGDGVEEVQVTIGLRDSKNTQITGNLNAGDELLVTNGAPIQSFSQDGDDGPPGIFGG